MAEQQTQTPAPAAPVKTSTLSGLEKSALLLLALGEKHAAAILQHMGPREVQELGMIMAGLTNVTGEMMEEVMSEFVATIGNQTALGLGSDEYIRNMLTSALGSDKASGMIDRILLGRNSKGLEQLKWMDPKQIAELIRLEHPQIISIVLSFLDPDQGAAVLSEFPEKVRSDIIMRVAALEGIQPNALQELDMILEKQFQGASNVKSSALGGVKKAADILNFVEGTIEASIIEDIQQTDEELAQEIQDNMFVFENLNDIDDRGMQTILREVSSEQLLLAMRGIDEGLKEKFFSNMSSRAADMLRDDLEAAAPVKLSEVEAAQKEILTVVRRLADAGEIMLGGGGEELV
jgi:flagellar motor switch protein FliG